MKKIMGALRRLFGGVAVASLLLVSVLSQSVYGATFGGGTFTKTGFTQKTDCSTVTGEAQECWDTNDDRFFIGNGTTAQLIGGAGASITGAGSNGALAFWTGASSLSEDPTELFWDTAGNFFGVGTNTPAFKLDVNGNSRITGKLTVTGVIDPTQVLLSGGDKKFGATDAGTVYLAPFANSTTAVQIRNAATSTTILNVDTSNNRVGIFETAPTQALHVSGNGRFSGTIVDASDVASVNANSRVLNSTGGGAFPSINWSTKLLIDTSVVNSVNWNSRSMFDTTGTVESVNWQSRFLADSTATTSLSWAARTLVDSTGAVSENWTTRRLFETDGTTPVLDWSNQSLRDSGNTASANWDTRVLTDNGGSTTLDWQNSSLTVGAVTVVDWANQTISDTGATLAIDWQTRLLHDASGNQSTDWDSRLLYDSAGSTSADWQNRQLAQSGGATVTDWEVQTLYDSSGVASVDWTGRFLRDTSAVQSSDWDNRTLNDLAGAEALSWSNRLLRDAGGTPTLDWENRELEGVWSTTNDFTVNGKLTVTGAIDPTSITLVPASPGAQAIIVRDSGNTVDRFVVTETGNMTFASLTSSGTISNSAGTSLLPSYTFTGDTNTGMYSSVGDTIEFTVGGQRELSISSTGVIADDNFLCDTGDATTPAYTFSADTDTGMFRSGANLLSFGTAGLEALRLDASQNTQLTGDLIVNTVGKKLRIKEGANASMGTATLVAGTVTVANTLVTATSRIFLTGQNSSGTAGELTISARTVGTDFTITSTSVLDTRSIAFWIVEPA